MGEQDNEKGESMAKQVLQIVASEAARRTLGQLGSPLIQVTVKGHVTNGTGINTLTIERVCASKSMTLPIVASRAATSALAQVAKSKASHEVTLQGCVAQSAAGNILFLQQIGNSATMPIIADECMRKKLAGMAMEKGGEITVRARMVEQAGNKVLILASEGAPCRR